MPKIICIDPGHGGADSGAVNGKRREADDNLRLALAVRKQLEQQGHTVVMTHTGLDAKVKVESLERRQIALRAKPDLFVSLHRNSAQKRDAQNKPMFSGGLPVLDTTARGIEVFIRNTVYRQAASDVLEQLIKVEHQANRGIKIGNFIVLDQMPMPSMLIELGFVSNTRDNELFDQHFDANATAIARGILEALGEGWKSPGQVETAPALGPYRLCAASFPTYEAAQVGVEALKAKGIPTWIIMPSTAKAE